MVEAGPPPRIPRRRVRATEAVPEIAAKANKEWCVPSLLAVLTRVSALLLRLRSVR